MIYRTKIFLHNYPIVGVLLIAVMLVVFAALLNSRNNRNGHETTLTAINELTQPSSLGPGITPTPTDTPSPTAPILPPAIPTLPFVVTSDPSLKSTLSEFLPPPVVGTLGPNGFEVKKWIVEACGKGKHTVIIKGVLISRGFIPHKITFQQSNNVFVRQFEYFEATPTSFQMPVYSKDFLQERLILFIVPFEIKRYRYVHVTIDFEPSSNVIPWSDDLFYPSKKISCSNN